MIRMSRISSLGKNNWIIPVFTQCVMPKPKQLSVELTYKRGFQNQTNAVFEDSVKEIKYKFLKDVLQGVMHSENSYFNSELALKAFFDNLPNSPPSEIIKILKLLAETKTRPIESIKTLCSLITTQKDYKYSYMDCANLLYSLSRLSYRDENLIDILNKNLVNLESIPNKVATNILVSLGELKYRDTELIQKLLECALVDTLSVKYSLNCLKALCYLNYSSPKVEHLIQLLSELKEIDFVRTVDYMNFIWASVMLNQVEKISSDHLSRVLSASFLQKILYQGVYPSLKWKLLNINAAVQQMPSYKGPFLNGHPQYKYLCGSVPKKLNTFLESVRDTLSYIIPQTGYINALVNIEAGFNLDIEYSEEPHDPESKNPIIKTGIMLLHYSDICSDGTMTGISQFKLNILKGLGYKIIVLPYTEYNPIQPLSLKISLLQSKIKKKETN